ncbi:hypothetical protein W02_24540 [Nitrospira sp. KM1]|nr:hypothetical protein W02_24540 [Nitrospira sp. KM1]
MLTIPETVSIGKQTPLPPTGFEHIKPILSRALLEALMTSRFDPVLSLRLDMVIQREEEARHVAG